MNKLKERRERFDNIESASDISVVDFAFLLTGMEEAMEEAK